MKWNKKSRKKSKNSKNANYFKKKGGSPKRDFKKVAIVKPVKKLLGPSLATRPLQFIIGKYHLGSEQPGLIVSAFNEIGKDKKGADAAYGQILLNAGGDAGQALSLKDINNPTNNCAHKGVIKAIDTATLTNFPYLMESMSSDALAGQVVVPVSLNIIVSATNNELKIWQQIDKSMAYQQTKLDLDINSAATNVDTPIELSSLQTQSFFKKNRKKGQLNEGLLSFEQNINGLSISSDGKLFATCGSEILIMEDYGGLDQISISNGIICIWDTESCIYNNKDKNGDVVRPEDMLYRQLQFNRSSLEHAQFTTNGIYNHSVHPIVSQYLGHKDCRNCPTSDIKSVKLSGPFFIQDLGFTPQLGVVYPKNLSELNLYISVSLATDGLVRQRPNSESTKWEHKGSIAMPKIILMPFFLETMNSGGVIALDPHEDNYWKGHYVPAVKNLIPTFDNCNYDVTMLEIGNSSSNNCLYVAAVSDVGARPYEKRSTTYLDKQNGDQEINIWKVDVNIHSPEGGQSMTGIINSPDDSDDWLIPGELSQTDLLFDDGDNIFRQDDLWENIKINIENDGIIRNIALDNDKLHVYCEKLNTSREPKQYYRVCYTYDLTSSSRESTDREINILAPSREIDEFDNDTAVVTGSAEPLPLFGKNPFIHSYTKDPVASNLLQHGIPFEQPTKLRTPIASDSDTLKMITDFRPDPFSVSNGNIYIPSAVTVGGEPINDSFDIAVFNDGSKIKKVVSRENIKGWLEKLYILYEKYEKIGSSVPDKVSHEDLEEYRTNFTNSLFEVALHLTSPFKVEGADDFTSINDILKDEYTYKCLADKPSYRVGKMWLVEIFYILYLLFHILSLPNNDAEIKQWAQAQEQKRRERVADVVGARPQQHKGGAFDDEGNGLGEDFGVSEEESEPSNYNRPRGLNWSNETSNSEENDNEEPEDKDLVMGRIIKVKKYLLLENLCKLFELKGWNNLLNKVIYTDEGAFMLGMKDKKPKLFGLNAKRYGFGSMVPLWKNPDSGDWNKDDTSNILTSAVVENRDLDRIETEELAATNKTGGKDSSLYLWKQHNVQFIDKKVEKKGISYEWELSFENLFTDSCSYKNLMGEAHHSDSCVKISLEKDLETKINLIEKGLKEEVASTGYFGFHNLYEKLLKFKPKDAVSDKKGEGNTTLQKTNTGPICKGKSKEDCIADEDCIWVNSKSGSGYCRKAGRSRSVSRSVRSVSRNVTENVRNNRSRRRLASPSAAVDTEPTNSVDLEQINKDKIKNLSSIFIDCIKTIKSVKAHIPTAGARVIMTKETEQQVIDTYLSLIGYIESSTKKIFGFKEPINLRYRHQGKLGDDWRSSILKLPQNVNGGSGTMDVSTRLILASERRILHQLIPFIIPSIVEDLTINASGVEFKNTTFTVSPAPRDFARGALSDHSLALNFKYVVLNNCNIVSVNSAERRSIPEYGHLLFKDYENVDFTQVDFRGKQISFINFSKLSLDSCKFNRVHNLITNEPELFRIEGQDGKFIHLDLSERTLFLKLQQTTIEDTKFNNSKVKIKIKNDTKPWFTWESYLMEVGFTDCEFIQTIYDSANIQNCGFYNCKLDKTSFSSASIISSNFNGCKLENISFLSAKIKKTIFRDCNLTNIDFNNTDLSSNEFYNCKFNKCKLEKKSFMLKTIQSSTLQDCNLTSADFNATNLKNTTFSNCNLTGATFIPVDVGGGAHQHATSDLTNVTFNNCQLSSITFQSVIGLTDRQNLFDGLDLRRTTFAGTDLTDTTFRNCNLEGASFQHAIITNCDFTGANLNNTNFEDAIGIETAIGIQDKNDIPAVYPEDVHAAFKLIKINSLHDFIKETNEEKWRVSSEEDIPSGKDFIDFIKKKLDNIIQKEESNNRKRELQKYNDDCFEQRIKHFQYDTRIVPQSEPPIFWNVFIFHILTYVDLQSDDFKKIYFSQVIEESATTYGEGGISCERGINERFAIKLRTSILMVIDELIKEFNALIKKASSAPQEEANTNEGFGSPGFAFNNSISPIRSRSRSRSKSGGVRSRSRSRSESVAEQWDVEQVKQWLSTVNLSAGSGEKADKYAEQFETARINGKMLLTLTLNDLMSVLLSFGVGIPIGHGKKILRAVAKLKKVVRSRSRSNNNSNLNRSLNKHSEKAILIEIMLEFYTILSFIDPIPEVLGKPYPKTEAELIAYISKSTKEFIDFTVQQSIRDEWFAVREGHFSEDEAVNTNDKIIEDYEQFLKNKFNFDSLDEDDKNRYNLEMRKELEQMKQMLEYDHMGVRKEPDNVAAGGYRQRGGFFKLDIKQFRKLCEKYFK